jgi:predicted nucleic acid-binding protein
MTIYADTSFIVAARFGLDTLHGEAVRFYAKFSEELWLWSPWHRVEACNTIRQLARNRDRRRGLSAAEAKALIRRLEDDVRCDYLLHMEADWRDVMRTASEISIGNAFDRACPGTDLLHVAYALELSAELFVTFDRDQLELAKAAGLKSVMPD